MVSTASGSDDSAAPVPRVGVGLFLFANPRAQPQHAGRFLLGHRTGSLGAETWALPGGHLEFGEGLEECAARETEEETGLKVRMEGAGAGGDTGVRFLTAVNSVMDGEGTEGRRRHYVTVFMVGVVDGDGEPVVMEPEKCKGWEWVTWEQLEGWAAGGQGEAAGGRVLFQPMRDLLVQRKGMVPTLE